MKKNDTFLLVAGQTVSTIGTVLHNVIFLWWATEYFKSPIVVGTTMSLLSISHFFTPFIGTWFDRVSVKRFIVFTDISRGVIILLLAYGAFTRSITPYQLYILLFCFGIFSSMFNPAINIFTPRKYPSEMLIKLNSIFHVSFSISNSIGPLIASLLLKFLSAAYGFLVNGISFIISGISEIFIEGDAVSSHSPRSTVKGFFSNLLNGFKKVYLNRILFLLIVRFSTLMLIIAPLQLYLMIILKDIRHLDPILIGIVFGANAVGSIVGGILMGFIGRYRLNFLLIGFITVGSTLMGIALITNPYLLVVVSVIAGIGLAMMNITFGTFLQISSPKADIGKIISIFMTIVYLTEPVGYVLGGILLSKF